VGEFDGGGNHHQGTKDTKKTPHRKKQHHTGIRHPASGIRHPASGIRHPASLSKLRLDRFI
jgi:hypothetical protein